MTGITFEVFLLALRMKETGGQPNSGDYAVGDNGKAIGPFQIWKEYWMDANVDFPYEDCNRYEYAVQVVCRYLQRYAKQAILDGDWERCARIHNGGPHGYKKEATVHYWFEVKQIIRRLRDGAK